MFRRRRASSRLLLLLLIVAVPSFWLLTGGPSGRYLLTLARPTPGSSTNFIGSSDLGSDNFVVDGSDGLTAGAALSTGVFDAGGDYIATDGSNDFTLDGVDLFYVDEGADGLPVDSTGSTGSSPPSNFAPQAGGPSSVATFTAQLPAQFNAPIMPDPVSVSPSLNAAAGLSSSTTQSSPTTTLSPASSTASSDFALQLPASSAAAAFDPQHPSRGIATSDMPMTVRSLGTMTFPDTMTNTAPNEANVKVAMELPSSMTLSSASSSATQPPASASMTQSSTMTSLSTTTTHASSAPTQTTTP